MSTYIGANRSVMSIGLELPKFCHPLTPLVFKISPAKHMFTLELIVFSGKISRIRQSLQILPQNDRRDACRCRKARAKKKQDERQTGSTDQTTGKDHSTVCFTDLGKLHLPTVA